MRADVDDDSRAYEALDEFGGSDVDVDWASAVVPASSLGDFLSLERPPALRGVLVPARIPCHFQRKKKGRKGASEQQVVVSCRVVSGSWLECHWFTLATIDETYDDIKTPVVSSRRVRRLSAHLSS